MNRLFATLVLTVGMCASANADIWTWADLKGDLHFVNTNTTIYTWLDEYSRVQFADTPGHESAVLVDLVWHSAANDLPEEEGGGSAQPPVKESKAWPGETEAERFERQAAEAYYCKRAQEVYDSYLKAPRLYKTLDNGERAYLSDEEATMTLSETKARVEELCG
jgi:hypothetical protein